MIRIFTVMVVVALTAVPCLLSQPVQSGRSSVSGIDYSLTNTGIFGFNIETSRAGFTWPRGSLQSYLFGSGLWFAAEKNPIPYRPRIDTLQKLVFLTYNPNSGASWAKPGEYPGTVPSVGGPILYHSTEYDQGTGAAFTAGRPAWPLWLPAGRVASSLYPGTFVADNADRVIGSSYAGPAYLPVSEQWVARFHDGDLNRYEGYGTSGVFPIGLQFQQLVYSWEQGDYSNVAILEYEIVNRSGDTLHRCYVGQASDPDIGRADNDRVGIHLVDGRAVAGLAYTESESMPQPYGTLVQVLLESPSVDANGFIANSNRRELGEKHEIAAFRNWTIENDPATIEARYQFVSQPILDNDLGPGDKRTMLSVGPFSMAPGDTAHFAMAYAVYDTVFTEARGNGDPRLAGVSGAGLDRFITRLIRDYANEQFQHVMAVEDNASNDAADLSASVAPNPARDAADVRFSLATGGDTHVSVFDHLGRQCFRRDAGFLPAGMHRLALDMTSLAEGTYTVVVASGEVARSARVVVMR